MGGRHQGLRHLLQRRIAQIQKSDDAHLRSLPASSRFLLAPVLSAVAAAAAAGDALRQWAYRQGLMRPTSLPCPVLSIGNLTTGGTGNTPFVEYAARHFLRVQRLPAMVLQLGHASVDETLMLRGAFHDDPVVVAEAATTGAEAREYLRDSLAARRLQYLRDNPAVRLVLLDGGLQALPLARDLELVMVNALSPFGNGRLVPRGTLLEAPRAALRRADAVLLHHADLAGEDVLREAQRQLAALAPGHALFMRTRLVPLSLRSLLPPAGAGSLDMSEPPAPGDLLPLSTLRGAAVVCLVGVGMPQTVEAHLRSLGAASVEGCGEYEDHHAFSLEEVRAAAARAQELSASGRHAAVVMTEKDYARQQDLFDAVFAQYAAAAPHAPAAGQPSSSAGAEAGSAGGSGPLRQPAEAGGVPGTWGAYVLCSGLEIVEGDRRFSSAAAGLNALLRMAYDNFRRRSYSL